MSALNLYCPACQVSVTANGATPVTCPRCGRLISANLKPAVGILEPSKKAKKEAATSVRTLKSTATASAAVAPFTAPPVAVALPASTDVPSALRFDSAHDRGTATGRPLAWALAVFLTLGLLGGGVYAFLWLLGQENPEPRQAKIELPPPVELVQMPPSEQNSVPQHPAPVPPVEGKAPDGKAPDINAPVPNPQPAPAPEPQPPAVAVNPPPAKLPPTVNMTQIDDAIARGVKYLKASQNGAGTWGQAGYNVGYTALPGLTLLECGVPANDPAVKKAAAFVRKNVANLNGTYELSLAVLFLDRLGDPADKALIRTLALRLLAGQSESGGWTYNVQVLSPKDSQDLLAYLQRTQPKTAEPMRKDGAGQVPTGRPGDLKNPLPGKDAKLPDLLGKDKDSAQPDPLSKLGKDDWKGPDAGGIIPFNPDGPAGDPKKPTDKDAPPAAKKEQAKGPPPVLPPNLRQIPAVARVGKGKGKGPAFRPGRDDNSNTQFALLALWTARRHGVPTDRALEAAYERFATSQDEEFGWGYILGHARGSPAMVGVGLLGLAMGHGASSELPKDEARIKSGLRAFARHIGAPDNSPGRPRLEGLYFLWTVERVAVLYKLDTIGGKNWYGWGAQMIVPNQNADGSWLSGGYPGSAATIDTCFALLFLKRSNLVQDLTDNLQLQMAITDPDGKK